MTTLSKQEYKQYLLDQLYAPYIACTLCPLSAGRTQVVFGRGNADARLLLLGEGPGKNEDLEGKPFVGRSGKLLSKILETLHISENNLYITNIVKCRPPKNRAPLPFEVTTCTNILLSHQIEIIKPTVICALGASAAHYLLQTNEPMSKIRGTIISKDTYSIIATYHPAYILRNPKEILKLTSDLELAYNASISNTK